MRLWEYDEFGEPWLENTPLVIVNPKKGKKTMRRRKRSNPRRRVIHRRGVRHNARRRRVHRRRNPYPLGGVAAAVNPRRRRRGRRNSPRRHRRMRHNPRLLGLTFPPLQSVLYAGVGFVGTPMLEGFLNGVLPVSVTTTTLGKYATRIASVLGLSWIAKMVLGRSQAAMVGIGGGAYVVVTAVKEFMPTLLPTTGLSAYAIPTASGMGSYSSSNLRAQQPPRQLSAFGAPNFGAINTAGSAPFGGARIVASRFRRFQ